MKTLIKNQLRTVLVISILLISSSIYAQSPGGQRGGQQGPPPIPDTEQIVVLVSDLANEISLTDEQKDQVLDLYITHFEEVKNKTQGNSRPNREEMEVSRNHFELEVKSLLTKEQKTKYKKYLKNMENNRPEPGRGR